MTFESPPQKVEVRDSSQGRSVDDCSLSGQIVSCDDGDVALSEWLLSVPGEERRRCPGLGHSLVSTSSLQSQIIMPVAVFNCRRHPGDFVVFDVTGPIPEELGELTELRSIILFENILEGEDRHDLE